MDCHTSSSYVARSLGYVDCLFPFEYSNNPYLFISIHIFYEMLQDFLVSSAVQATVIITPPRSPFSYKRLVGNVMKYSSKSTYVNLISGDVEGWREERERFHHTLSSEREAYLGTYEEPLPRPIANYW